MTLEDELRAKKRQWAQQAVYGHFHEWVYAGDYYPGVAITMLEQVRNM